jgi:hypothetical protein
MRHVTVLMSVQAPPPAGRQRLAAHDVHMRRQRWAVADVMAVGVDLHAHRPEIRGRTGRLMRRAHMPNRRLVLAVGLLARRPGLHGRMPVGVRDLVLRLALRRGLLPAGHYGRVGRRRGMTRRRLVRLLVARRRQRQGTAQGQQ